MSGNEGRVPARARNGSGHRSVSKLPMFADVHVATPQPKKSVSSVQIGQPSANAAASIGQSSGSRAASLQICDQVLTWRGGRQRARNYSCPAAFNSVPNVASDITSVSGLLLNATAP